MNNKISFEVEGFNVIDSYSDEQFALVEIYVCHDGNNLHNMPIELSVLKKAKRTLKNKFLVAGYNGDDFEGHEPDEAIVGFFPESSKMSFKKKDGKTYLVAQALMSKIYASWAYDIFVDDNERAVSMEITILEVEEDEDGRDAIKTFIFNGVTLLGKEHMPACEGSDASIIKFSTENSNKLYKENASKVYSKYFNNSNKIKEDFVSTMNLTENSGKEVTDNMEKDNVVVEEASEKELEKETEFDSQKEESDDTVIMSDGKTEEYEKEDSEEKEKDDEDADIDDKDEEEVFEKSTSLTVEQKYEIFRAAIIDSKKLYGYVESYDDEYVYIYDYSDGFTYRHSYTLDGTSVEISEDCERVMRGGYILFSSEETKKFEEEELESLKTENCELKEKIETYEAKLKEDKVESILSSIIDDVEQDVIDDLRNKSKEYSVEQINVFENEVKAVAFESLKKKSNKYSFARVTINNIEKGKNPYSW